MYDVAPKQWKIKSKKIINAIKKAYDDEKTPKSEKEKTT